MITEALALKAEGLTYSQIGARLGLNRDQVAGMFFRHRHGNSASVRVGRRLGEASQNAKLTTTQVREMRARRAGGEPLRALAADYGIGWRYVSHICRRRSWAHVA